MNPTPGRRIFFANPQVLISQLQMREARLLQVTEDEALPDDVRIVYCRTTQTGIDSWVTEIMLESAQWEPEFDKLGRPPIINPSLTIEVPAPAKR